MSQESVLRMENIDKRFFGVHALDNLSFECRPGEVHVLMGENGAGKSTLLKILGGVYQADGGTIYIDGQPVKISNPIDAKAKGISLIHQELSMCNNMTIAENIFRGEEPTVGGGMLVDFTKMLSEAQRMLDNMDMDLRADTMVGTLSVAQQQMVEIAGALSKNARIVIMDEPTASLTEREVQALFKTVATLKAQDVCIIYVSHRMNETFAIGDRVTVMRDGKYIGTKVITETTEDELVEMMVGRPLTDIYGGETPVGGEVVFECKNLVNSKLKNVSFKLRKGEILGFSGLVGAGRTELARALFGIDKLESGQILIEGKEVHINRARDAIDQGIGMVPEDRKGAGLVLKNTVGFNLTLTVVNEFIKGIFVNRTKENEIMNDYFKKLTIKAHGPQQRCADLSGGNQQKVVIAKWLATKPKYLILDEPTRGIDVGAKAEIYSLMNALAAEGLSIIFISSDLPEIINLSSRVVVMREGEVTGILDSKEEELTQVKIMKYATGGLKNV
ncbi:sugar ABC transporter ATP-binding protein [Oscillospiraceae bacterium MB08-C2-2]|nr:sugar ABC transporter ATP-binding protein [Oscillospiraceae bacterium MB08-C2-2]